MSAICNNSAPDYNTVNANPTSREIPRSGVARAEERLAAARLQLVREKRRLRDASVREQTIRECAVGRMVWDLVERGKLERAVIDLIRSELRGRLTPTQVPAFFDTIFE
jgi:hypothetical protein